MTAVTLEEIRALPAENAQKLKSLAEHADTVNEYEVRKLCWSAEGDG